MRRENGARVESRIRNPMKIRDRLYNAYSFLQEKMVPQLRYSQSHYEDVLDSHITSKSDWLDIGCGHQLLPPWRLEQEKNIVGRANLIIGIDCDFPSLLKHETISHRVGSIAGQLPFKDHSFDVATANMVVEHLDNPHVQFAEINRVLKPGGRFIFHTPNEAGYFTVIRKMVPKILVKKLAALLDGRVEDDVFETHYQANREHKIISLARKTNFEVEHIKFISSHAVCMMIPPVAAIELVWIRLLMLPSLRRFRTNMIVTLKKKAG